MFSFSTCHTFWKYSFVSLVCDAHSVRALIVSVMSGRKTNGDPTERSPQPILGSPTLSLDTRSETMTWIHETCMCSGTFCSRMWPTQASRHACSQWDVQSWKQTQAAGLAQRGDLGAGLLSAALFVTLQHAISYHIHLCNILSRIQWAENWDTVLIMNRNAL